MPEADTEKFDLRSQTEDQQKSFREWGRLFRLCSNPLPAGTEVGTVVIPTGDWLERAGAAFNFFVRVYNDQEYKPHLVITGQNSSQYVLPYTGADANKVARAIRTIGKWNERSRDIPQIRRDRIITEIDRIHRYRKKGDVATEEEIAEYVNWLRGQNP